MKRLISSLINYFCLKISTKTRTIRTRPGCRGTCGLVRSADVGWCPQVSIETEVWFSPLRGSRTRRPNRTGWVRGNSACLSCESADGNIYPGWGERGRRAGSSGPGSASCPFCGNRDTVRTRCRFWYHSSKGRGSGLRLTPGPGRRCPAHPAAPPETSPGPGTSRWETPAGRSPPAATQPDRFHS